MNEFTVSSLQLHKALEVQSQHSHWLKRALTRAMLDESVDYIVPVENDCYKYDQVVWMTMEAAKSIAMLQANEKGKQVRNAYIAMEKHYLSLMEAKVLNQGNMLSTLLPVSVRQHAKASGYHTLAEIKELMQYKTSPQSLKAMFDHAVVSTMTAGNNTYYRLSDAIQAYNDFKADSDLIGSVTFEHVFTGLRFEV